MTNWSKKACTTNSSSNRKVWIRKRVDSPYLRIARLCREFLELSKGGIRLKLMIVGSRKDRVLCNLHQTILRHLKSQNIMLQKRSLLTSMRTLCQVLTQIITCRSLKLNTSKLKSRSKIHHNLIIILTQITYPEMKNRSRIITMNEKIYLIYLKFS